MTVTWITGASSGIGRALALELAGRGATIVASARSQDRLDALAAEAPPGRIHAVACDITDAPAIARTVAAIEDAHGPIGRAVLNAGTYAPDTADDFSYETFRQTIDVNLLGTAACVAALLPRWIDRKVGHLAIVSSVAGYRGLPRAISYGASKSALNTLCEAMKFDFDRLGLKIQLINPGFVRTPLTDQNDFKMPALMEVDDAARRIADGLDSARFEIAFPKRFVFWLQRLRGMPPALYFPIVRRMTKQ